MEKRLAHPDDEEVRSACPLLWELLTLDQYADGSERVLPTIRIERTSGGYVVALQEHSSRLQVQVKVLKLADLAVALESLLASDPDAWRAYDSPKVKAKDLEPKKEKA